MEIKVNFLDKLRLEAKFDDFTVVTDQPIRYKGDGSAPGPKDALSAGILDEYCLQIYNPGGDLFGSHLIDTNSGNTQHDICSLSYVQPSDGKVGYFPSNLVDNLYVSNGMSAGNMLTEAQLQCFRRFSNGR